MSFDPQARWQLLQGDVRKRILELPDRCVDCVVTSPPYWGLREYGAASDRALIGIEESLEDYLDAIAGVFDQVRRVLKPQGTLWLNMGDTYLNTRKNGDGTSSTLGGTRRNAHENMKLRNHPKRAEGLKRKDLVGLPWMVAFAIRARGWRLRCDIIWEKVNPTPESVEDRPTRGHEYFFLLSQRLKYYYNADAIKEPCSKDTHSRGKGTGKKSAKLKREDNEKQNASFASATAGAVEMRNPRTVWRILSSRSNSDHTARMPPELARRAVLAGCPPDGLVFDPFTGSGTTGAVAVSLGRRFIGTELSKKYCREARETLGLASVADAAEGTPIQFGFGLI